MRGFARGAIAVLVLIAWAIPCHDREAAAMAKARRGGSPGGSAAAKVGGPKPSTVDLRPAPHGSRRVSSATSRRISSAKPEMP